MKSLVLLLSLYSMSFAFSKCGGSGPQKPDQSTPQGTMQLIFAAARSGDLSALPQLCDPSGKGDGDTKRYICGAADNPEEFREYFAKGKLTGNAEIQGDRAKVPFLFGPDGQKPETMNMVKQDGKWYLSSF